MKFPPIAAYAGLLLAAFMGNVHAAPAKPLHTELTLTRIAQGQWRADYVFAEPITTVELGAQAGAYRQQAWRTLTPGVRLVTANDKERMHSASPRTRLSIEISAYDDFVEGQYAPINRFSDGGADFYLGFLYGTLTQGHRERSMDVALQLRGLPGETALAPALPGTDLSGYAYFGPRKPDLMGNVNVIIDPLAPAWMREVIDDTTKKVSQFYEQAFQRKLMRVPLISVAIVGFEGPPGGFSIKGGVAGGGISYRFQGQGLVQDRPKIRSYMARLVAHEMAHMWQVNLKRGGLGEEDPWIHEGGAEAVMLEALRATGIFTQQASDAYAQGLLKECGDLKGDVTSNRGFYACGFKRFQDYPMPPVPLWRALMAKSEASGEFYSEPMIRAILK